MRKNASGELAPIPLCMSSQPKRAARNPFSDRTASMVRKHR